MLVTFETQSFPRITFFADVARRLLKLMGQSGNVPGALAPEDVDGARQALQKAVDRDDIEDPQDSHDEEEEGEAVSIRHRALPLLDLLAAAAAAKAHVTWTEGRTPP